MKIKKKHLKALYLMANADNPTFGNLRLDLYLDGVLIYEALETLFPIAAKNGWID